MVELNEFTVDEIAELNRYIMYHVRNSVLSKIHALSQNPIEKGLCYVNTYRILNSCKNYASTEVLKAKLTSLLKESETVYTELYPLLIEYDIPDSFGKSRIYSLIITILRENGNDFKINKLIDALLIFGEKIELNSYLDYPMVNLENDYGKEKMKDIRKILDEEGV